MVPAAPASAAAVAGRLPKITIGHARRLVLGSVLRGPAKETGFPRLRYQWLRNGKPIKGATHRSYKLGKRDLGQRIALRLTLFSTAGKKYVVTSRALNIPKPKRKRRGH